MALHYFDKDIAVKYGIEPAILLNNIYYWVEKNKANNTSYYDGNYWTYNSARAFSELFPYMNEMKIRRALKVLEDEGLIVTGNYNKLAYDRTMWYAITEKGFETLKSSHSSKSTNASNKNDKCILQKQQMDVSNMQDGCCTGERPIPNNNTDNNSNNNTDNIYIPVIDYLNTICNTNYKPTTKNTQRLIRARQNEGFTLEDFKTVIDKKYKSWKGTTMAVYLRPETLFGTKFEGYLNEQEVVNDNSRKDSGIPAENRKTENTEADYWDSGGFKMA